MLNIEICVRGKYAISNLWRDRYVKNRAGQDPSNGQDCPAASATSHPPSKLIIGRCFQETPPPPIEMLFVRPSSPPPCLAAPPPPLTRPCPARRLLPCVAVAAGTGQRGRRRGDDDYHATIRSLNSRGRHTPRKSLGQVRTRSARRKDNDRPVLGPFEVLIRLVSSPLFAQNYMLNSSVNEELVRVAGVGEGDVVLEIGPGTGSLTNVLIDAGATVVAIEKVSNSSLSRPCTHFSLFRCLFT